MFKYFNHILNSSDPGVLTENPKWYQLQEMMDKNDLPHTLLGEHVMLNGE